VCRINALWRPHCCALAVFCWGETGASANAERQHDVAQAETALPSANRAKPRPARVGLSDALALAATSYVLSLVAPLFLPETRGKHLTG
jgi:hypothetical protein